MRQRVNINIMLQRKIINILKIDFDEKHKIIVKIHDLEA